jgi:alpha-beta hydrolase superfamily lysophospholipase
MLGNIGVAISKISGIFFGKKSKSPLLDKLSFGAFNGQFKPNRTLFDWLSRDEKKVDKYVKDPYCGSVFSKGFFYDILTGLKKINKKTEIGKIPTALPIFFISGEKDPVGKNSSGVKKVVKMYEKSGIENIDIKFYPGARHEILNEINREEVYRDILTWISNNLK